MRYNRSADYVPLSNATILSRLLAAMHPPARFADATFSSYEAHTPSQAEALHIAQAFAERLRTPRPLTTRLRRMLGRQQRPEWQGLYFVGPAGTGKTHLLTAMYHALPPEVPCAFLHSSTLFRATTPPERHADAVADQYACCVLTR